MLRGTPSVALSLLATSCMLVSSEGWMRTTTNSAVGGYGMQKTALSASSIATGDSPSWFSAVDDSSIEQLKIQLLQLGAALDRGQAYNPTSGEYYAGQSRK